MLERGTVDSCKPQELGIGAITDEPMADLCASTVAVGVVPARN